MVAYYQQASPPATAHRYAWPTTEKKILEAATNIITEKIIADMVDDMAGSSRGEMPYVVYEYFLGKFGVRTLADFYLLELIEGLKMFHQNNPRIGAPAKYTINMYLNTYMPWFMTWCHALVIIPEPSRVERSDADEQRYITFADV